MDFSTRGTNQAPAPSATPRANTDSTASHRPTRKFKSDNKWLNIASIILLFGIAVILVAIAFLPRSTNNNESKYINSKNFQAVDVSVGGNNGDQIYFGNIQTLNGNYLVLDNVFYIPSNSTSSNITLEPLVCQIDAPFNRMIINRASVNWWENLQSSGKVAQAITNYQKSSKTPACPQTASPSSSSSTASGTGSSSSTTSGAGSSTSKSSTTNTTAP